MASGGKEDGGVGDWSMIMSKLRKMSPGPEMESLLTRLRLSVIETITRPQTAPFLSEFVPFLVDQLTRQSQNASNLDPSSTVHRCRVAMLRCMSRIVGWEESSVKPFLSDICTVLMDILSRDNEESALIALHTVIDVQKTFRQHVEPMVPAFLDFVIGLLDRFDVIVTSLQKSLPSNAANSNRAMLKPSVGSLKIILECPVIVVLLFQLHRRFINDYIGRFVPVVMKALTVNLEPPLLSEMYPVGQNTDSSGNPLKAAFCDYISTKIKILSFFAYISRGFIGSVRQYAPEIPSIVLTLLKDTPLEIPSARKELLVAVRHILSTDIRSSFLPVLGSLLEERVLLGEGWTCQTFFRPLAYSLLADLVHHVRLELSQKHLLHVINLYCRLLNDPSLPVGIQTMSAKLMLNLIDPVMGEKVERSHKKVLLHKMLNALLFKVTCISRLAVGENSLRSCIQTPFYSYLTLPDDSPPTITSLITHCDAITTDSWKEGPKELKFLFKTVMGTMKAVILSLKSNASAINENGENGTSGSLAVGMNLGEAQSFIKFFSEGLDCFHLLSSYSSTLLDPKSSRAFSVSSIPSDEKELLDQFAYVFTLLELPHFYDVIEKSLAILASSIRHNFALLAIPQYFLAISGLSKHFSSILARFLVDRMCILGASASLPDSSSADGDLDAAIHLRLFKLLFLSVSVYPEENEAVLQPYIGEIIMQCLKGRQGNQSTAIAISALQQPQQQQNATQSHSIHYFYLLRSLFRSIGGGRYEALYKEVLPLLPLILEELNRLIFDRDSVLDTATTSAAATASHREVYVELCLTVPVRLSVLLPYLPLLMKPLVLSLSSSPELIGQGLRTLELCVDNLTQDFLDPVITPISDDLLKSLWRLLQPSPSVLPAHAQVAMRVLGKLGGRSRRIGKLITQPAFEPIHQSSSSPPATKWFFELGPAQRGLSIEFSTDSAVQTAADIISEPCSPAHQPFLRDAFNIVRHFVLCSVSKVPSSYTNNANNGMSSELPLTHPSMFQDCSANIEAGSIHRALIKNCFLSLFKSLVSMSSAFEDDIKALLTCVFVDLLGRIVRMEGIRIGMAIFEDVRMLIDVLIHSASSCQNEGQGGSNLAITLIVERIVTQSPSVSLSTINQLFFDRLMSFCYEGSKSLRPGLSFLISQVCNTTIDCTSENMSSPPLWIGSISTRFLRSLLFLIKDSTNLSSSMASRSLGILEDLIVTRVSQSVYRLLNACMRLSSPALSPIPFDTQSESVSASNANSSNNSRLQANIAQSVTVLVAELSCPNGTVREVVQSCFQLIADARGMDVTELLLPFRDRFLPSIFTKPLRALPFSMQIGHIDAITYCLSLRPPLIGWSDELLRMLQEVLALAETDDHNLMGNKSGQLKNTAILIGLRVVCIRFLATCLPFSDLQNPKQGMIRNHIVSVFFKALYSRSPEVVEVAKRGLELVVANQSKLPKDLLQLGLRPVLMNLAEAKRLTLAGLEGLSRVLQLLTSYFKAEIGRKLLDHLSVWADPKVLEEASGRHLMDIPDAKIIAAILSIFPLLPSSANVFVTEVVRIVADLELLVSRRSSSPFRAPLFAFLQKYPVEAAETLSESITNSPILSFFSDLLYRCSPSSPATAAISKECVAKAPQLFPIMIQPNHPPSVRLEYLRILVGIGQHSGRLLASSRLFRDLIGTLWSNVDMLLRKDAALILGEEEVDLLMQLSRHYVINNPGDSEFVFAWLALLRPPLSVDPSFLPKFLSTSWLPLCSNAELNKALKLWLSFSNNPEVPLYSKALVTRLIAVPIIQLSENSSVQGHHPIDAVFMNNFRQQVWLRDGRYPVGTGSFFAIYELQLTASLLSLSSLGLASKYRKDILDFLYNRAATQEPIVKLFSLSLQCFIEMSSHQQGSPSEQVAVVGRTLSAMLKSTNLETRGTVRNAILSIASLSPQNICSHNLRSFLESDTVSIPAVISIWMAVCEHPLVFLNNSPQLAHCLVLSFCRFGQSIMAVPEQKMYGPKMLLLSLKAMMSEEVGEGIDCQLIRSAAVSLLKLSLSFMDGSTDSESARTSALAFLELAFLVSSPELILSECDLSGLERIIGSSAMPSSSQSSQMTPAVATPTSTASSSQLHHSHTLTHLHQQQQQHQSYFHYPEEEVKTVNGFLVQLLHPLADSINPVVILEIFSNCPRVFDSFIAFTSPSKEHRRLQEWILSYLFKLSAQFPLLKSRVDSLLTECLNGVRLFPSVIHIIKEEFAVVSSVPSMEGLISSLYRLVQKMTKDFTGGMCDMSVVELTFMELFKLALEQSEPFANIKNGLSSALMSIWTRPGLVHCHKEILGIIRSSLSGASEDAGMTPDATERTPKISQKDCIELMKNGQAIFSSSDRVVVRSFFDLLSHIYTNCTFLRSTEALAVLQPVFLCGLLERDTLIRQPLQVILLSTLSPTLSHLSCQLLVGLDWSQVGARFWLRSFVSIVLEYFVGLSTESDPLQYTSRVLFDPKTPSIVDDTSEIALLMQSAASTGPSFLSSLASLSSFNDNCARSLFISLFPTIWGILGANQRGDLETELVKMLSKQELTVQRYMRPNVPETLLEAATRCRYPSLSFTPQLVRYLSQIYCGWFSGLLLLERQCMESPVDQEIITEISCTATTTSHMYMEKSQVALASMYERIGEDDMWYGMMRRKAVFPETIVALSLAQSGEWPSALSCIENTLQRARIGSIGYLSSEYSIWEREWYQCAKTLQQWDLVGEVAKVENDCDLQLESIWHSADWSSQTTQSAVAAFLKSPSVANSFKSEMRRKCYEGLLLLQQLKESPDNLNRFHGILEEVMAVGMKEWWMLPNRPVGCHSIILESFQYVVELQEAQLIFANIAIPQHPTHSRQQFMQELKGLLGTWRDRLPNPQDCISTWSDLLAWRQHVYGALSSAFHTMITPTSTPIPPQSTDTQPLQSQSQQSQQPQPSQQTHPLAFRGYHETAWLINRFARICRKNGLLDVCLSTLNRIYTLPNIEIQDAFLKLREQTRCYMTEAVDLPLALEVVNATNLNYFNSAQKAEFFTLKAIIYMRLGMLDEANRILAQAVQIDLNLPKGWAVWAGYNDLRFQQTNDRTYAVNAINCYLQAASLHKSAKCRKFLARVLWLSTFEDDAGSALKPFELYASELPIWYWIFFIPQLITSLNRKEYRQARFLLIKIAKTFPQALYSSLRAAIEDYRQSPSNSALSGAGISRQSASSSSSCVSDANQSQNASSGIASPPPPSVPVAATAVTISPIAQKIDGLAEEPLQTNVEPTASAPRRTAAEEAEEIMSILKTAYPLLTLSIENLVDHLVNRLRATPDEDLFRIITTLYTDACQQLSLSIGAATGTDDSGFRSAVDSSLRRVSFMINSFPYLQQKYKAEFDAEFITSSPSLPEIVNRLRRWRSKLEESVANLPSSLSIDTLSRYLTEFEHQKYDDVEVPGQLLTVPSFFLTIQLAEGPADFIRIAKIHSVVKIVKKHGTSYRRITFIGHDGSRHSFLVQNPVARTGRREERFLQFFRLLNGPMSRKIATKRMNLEFSLPVIIPISSHARLVRDDCQSVSFDEIVSKHVHSQQSPFVEPIQFYLDSLLEYGKSETGFKRGSSDYMNLRLEIIASISRKTIPENTLLNFMASAFPSSTDYWLFRKLFTQQFALATFMCYVMAFGHRTPSKYSISLSSGQVLVNEIVPIPFRFTPNIQIYMGHFGIEGIFAECIRSTASIFTQVEKGEMGLSLPLFLRDELSAWLLTFTDSQQFDTSGILDREAVLFNSVLSYDHDFCSSRIKPNIELFNKRLLTLACVREIELAQTTQLKNGDDRVLMPANQAILDLISCATNPQKISLMDPVWQPWF